MTKKTTDIYFAAALLALGAKLENVNREDPKHMEFEFSDQKFTTTSTTQNISVLPLDEWETQMANGSLMVSASAYADAIRRMKSLVHSRS